MTQKQTWNAGRFLKTVTFFDIFPFLNFIPCLKNMILGQQQQTQPFIQSRIGTILVVGDREGIRAPIVKNLWKKNYPVRVLVPNLEEGESEKQVLQETRATNLPEYCQANLSRSGSWKPELMAGVQAVILTSLEPEETETLIQISSSTLGIDPNITPLFDFTRPTPDLQATWGAVDDIVMGGVSESHLRLGSHFAIFSGNVSTANSGGFASVRNRNFNPPLDLSSYDGILLRVKGDSQRYKFILRCEGKWDGVSYCYSFDTVANTWIDVQIPFADLIPTFRAKTVNDAAAFDASRMYSMQLMLSKFEYDGALNPRFTPGHFELQLESIKAYGDRPTSKLILVSFDDTMLEQKVRESGLSYTIVRSGNANFDAIARLCAQAIDSPEAVNQVLEASDQL
jgi:hypothetical protein